MNDKYQKGSNSLEYLLYNKQNDFGQKCKPTNEYTSKVYYMLAILHLIRIRPNRFVKEILESGDEMKRKRWLERTIGRRRGDSNRSKK